MADNDLIGRAIHANVVGIIAQIDPARRHMVRTLKQADPSIPSVCDIQRIGRRHVAHPLRLPHIWDDLHHFSGIEIDDTHSVILKLSYEKTMSSNINGHVINPADDITERNLRIQQKGRSFVSPTAAAEKHSQNREWQSSTRHDSFSDVLGLSRRSAAPSNRQKQ